MTFLGVLSLQAQNREYAAWLVDTLSSESMYGRGYVNKGDKIAAEFISSEYEKVGLIPFVGTEEENKTSGQQHVDKQYSHISKKSNPLVYYQAFTIPINTFPGNMQINIDDKELEPGNDFVVSSSSPAVNGTYDLVWEKDIDFEKGKYKKKLKNKVIVSERSPHEFKGENPFHSAGIIYLIDGNVSWHVSDGFQVKDFFTISTFKSTVPGTSKTITLDIENKYYEKYPTQNVIGYIEGIELPDSFIVFSAHYDHLGQMGSEIFFPGAHDNASGTAMMLDLAGYFSEPENQPKYSIAFMALSAEEAGLHGSFYYVHNPLFDLEKIRFVVNLDIVGSGSEGIKVVNGSVHQNEYDLLVKINEEKNLLEKVSKRGEAANSDHFPFHSKGVPSFFIYTLGKESLEYHTVHDTPENAPLTEYEDFFNLILEFVDQL